MLKKKPKKITDEMTEEEYEEIVFNFETCEDAIQFYDGYFYQCPVCNAIVQNDGNMFHREQSIYRRN